MPPIKLAMARISNTIGSHNAFTTLRAAGPQSSKSPISESLTNSPRPCRGCKIAEHSQFMKLKNISKSGEIAVEIGPHVKDPTTNAANDNHHGNQQDGKQNSVFDQRRAVLITS